MSTKSTLKEAHKSEIKERSEEELLEEEISNQKHRITLLNLIAIGTDQNLFNRRLL